MSSPGLQIRVLSAGARQKKKAAKRCCTPFCRRPARLHRSICNTCAKRAWRAKYPIKATFENLRSHAKERRKPFALTLEQWTAFCERTNYHETKGRRPAASTVDRVRPWEGYAAGNIRVLSHAENSARQDAAPDWEDMAEAEALLAGAVGGKPF